MAGVTVAPLEGVAPYALACLLLWDAVCAFPGPDDDAAVDTPSERRRLASHTMSPTSVTEVAPPTELLRRSTPRLFSATPGDCAENFRKPRLENATGEVDVCLDALEVTSHF